MIYKARLPTWGLTMELDAPKSQNFSKIMVDIRAQYEDLARKNQEELDKYWSQQIKKSTPAVTSHIAGIGATQMTFTELRYSLVLGDQSGLHEKSVGQLGELKEVEAHYATQMEQLLLHLESELAQTQAEGQHHTQEYESLRLTRSSGGWDLHLLEEGEEFDHGDTLDCNCMQCIQKTTTLRTADGKGVSEVNDARVLRR